MQKNIHFFPLSLFIILLGAIQIIRQGYQVQKNQRPNLAISIFRKGQILICWNNNIQSQNFIKYWKFCSDFSKIGLKIYAIQHSKRPKKAKWAIHFISGNLFKKGNNWVI